MRSGERMILSLCACAGPTLAIVASLDRDARPGYTPRRPNNRIAPSIDGSTGGGTREQELFLPLTAR